jgi:hypothetical protein
MAFVSLRSLSSPRILLLVLFTQICLAQGSTFIRAASATADARKGDPSSTISEQSSITSSAPAQTHTVQVGLADHKFRPDVIEAEVGDVSYTP